MRINQAHLVHGRVTRLDGTAWPKGATLALDCDNKESISGGVSPTGLFRLLVRSSHSECVLSASGIKAQPLILDGGTSTRVDLVATDQPANVLLPAAAAVAAGVGVVLAAIMTFVPAGRGAAALPTPPKHSSKAQTPATAERLAADITHATYRAVLDGCTSTVVLL